MMAFYIFDEKQNESVCIYIFFHFVMMDQLNLSNAEMSASSTFYVVVDVGDDGGEKEERKVDNGN